MEPYYTVNDDRNNALADLYRALAAQESTPASHGLWPLSNRNHQVLENIIYCLLPPLIAHLVRFCWVIVIQKAWKRSIFS